MLSVVETDRPVTANSNGSVPAKLKGFLAIGAMVVVQSVACKAVDPVAQRPNLSHFRPSNSVTSKPVRGVRASDIIDDETFRDIGSGNDGGNENPLSTVKMSTVKSTLKSVADDYALGDYTFDAGQNDDVQNDDEEINDDGGSGGSESKKKNGNPMKEPITQRPYMGRTEKTLKGGAYDNEEDKGARNDRLSLWIRKNVVSRHRRSTESGGKVVTKKDQVTRDDILSLLEYTGLQLRDHKQALSNQQRANQVKNNMPKLVRFFDSTAPLKAKYLSKLQALYVRIDPTDLIGVHYQANSHGRGGDRGGLSLNEKIIDFVNQASRMSGLQLKLA